MTAPQLLPNPSNLQYVEQQLAAYLDDPAQVAPEWQALFARWEELRKSDGRGTRGPTFARPSIFNPHGAPSVGTQQGEAPRLPADEALHIARLQERVDMLVRNYRVRGHRIAQVDPLGAPRPYLSELDPAVLGFTEADLDRPFSAATIQGEDVQTLRRLLERLRNTYCRSIGVQFMHIDDLEIREWLQRRMEGSENHIELPRQMQLRILTRLTDAVIFEEFIRKKYVGAKSFSLEGAETLIPMLDLAIEKAGSQGIREIVMGMAHRGRLNVLANILGKSPQQIFREFEDVAADRNHGRGDVKYHLGHSCDWTTLSGQKLHISLCFNPSHLEFVNPVALGRMRAKQDRAGDTDRQRGMVLLIHGDAAFIGEGIVQETLNLSQLPGYTVGGTLHIVVNNQIGFTTSPEEGRSSTYATDIAKMLQVPIFHVNGEDPEAAAQVIDLAMDFRSQFRRDVVIDMYCYRRWGHNEGDEPSFTQPLLYRAIEQRPSVRDGYLRHLLSLGGISREEADRIAQQRRTRLEEALSVARGEDYRLPTPELQGIWAGYRGGEEPMADDVETAVGTPRLCQLLERLTQLPDGFNLHRVLRRGWEHRRQMAAGQRPLDWSAAEALALATLATQQVRIRLSGQDSQRGTFSQRHAVLHDTQTGATYMPLAHLADDQAPVEIYNSPLSEAGVLGFEYGYSLDCPDGLVLWEAQFGDFANAAQVIIDQFIASAEDKWRRLSGLVLLLPHGFEGQGPEHSSARLERFLVLAADENLQIVVPSTPAQYFHVLRRQGLRRWRKPLVIFTPKSLLRHPQCVSQLHDLACGRFLRVLPDTAADPRAVGLVLMCSGKLYYELAEYRAHHDRRDVALVRIEQLYPFPAAPLSQALSPYAPQTPIRWVQEEPENMGAWRFLKAQCGEWLLGRYALQGVSRPASASPATGSAAVHKQEQQELIARAFARDA
jgi:2-oxoglutarate dehydrogenase E1 component